MGIRSLARELNLSIGTVSRALNDRPDVNEGTRARVKEAARLRGYVPDQSGRSLRKGRTGIVAAIIPASGIGGQSDSGFFRTLEGCRRGLLAQELDLIVLFRGAEEDPLESLRRVVSRKLADAVIINQTRPNDPRLDYLRAAGIEHVALGRAGPDDLGNWVDFDHATAGAEAARLFLRAGHRELALVLSAWEMHYELLLAEAFRAEAARYGLGPDSVRVVRSGPNGHLVEEGRALFASARRPTAVLAGHESVAAALYGDLGGLGLRPGVDIGLISASPTVDNQSLSQTLTHFDADLEAAGGAVAERIVALLSEPGMARKPLGPALMPMRLRIRDSHLGGVDARDLAHSA
ncbi:LacI family DNA-binding transcriptional regulator [Amaricoccus solimangrovi]|uniref:LacI family transcriptional regulator n=1 Tax=Amaricoccus solimangrovi TaxID=2589815 RepID=A0A501WT41_9RHOB|nr:LacI family DNA-binding transcriptional regulator [Amaricoccus solimangrovi]TPE52538.1 LacI family transcriptional regulator [Amaricoccus solimangrovi]